MSDLGDRARVHLQAPVPLRRGRFVLGDAHLRYQTLFGLLTRQLRIRRQDESARHVPNGRQFAYMVVVVGPHDRDRVLDARHSAPAHGRKQHVLFLAHMHVQFAEQSPQSGGPVLQMLGPGLRRDDVAFKSMA